MPTLFFSDISTKRRSGLIYSADVLLYILRISSRNNFSPKSHQAATSKLFFPIHDKTLCAQRLYLFFFLTRTTCRIFIETDLRLHANTGRKNQLLLIYPNLGRFSTRQRNKTLDSLRLRNTSTTLTSFCSCQPENRDRPCLALMISIISLLHWK